MTASSDNLPASFRTAEVFVLPTLGSGATRVLAAFGPEFDAHAAAVAANIPSAAKAVVLDQRPCFHGTGSWAPRATWTLLEMCLAAPAGSPARAAAVRFLQKRYPTYEWFAGAWEIDIAGSWATLSGIELQTGYNVETQAARARFAEMVADRYVGALVRAVRTARPSVVVLGPALDGDAPSGAFTASARFADGVLLADSEPSAIVRALGLVGAKPLFTPSRDGWARVAQAPNAESLAIDPQTELHAGSLGEKPALLELLAADSMPAITRAADTRVVVARERDRHSVVFDSGAGDGFTVGVDAPASATGYTAVMVDAEMRAGLEFKVVATTASGTFASPVQLGGLGRRRVLVRLDRLVPQGAPATTLDLATLRSIGLAVRGGQANGTIKLYGVKLYKPSE